MASEYAETCRSINNNIIVNKLVVFDFLTCTFQLLVNLHSDFNFHFLYFLYKLS